MISDADIMEVYLIDDDRILNLVHTRLLQKHGFQGDIRSFTSGEEAIKDINQRSIYLENSFKGKVLILLDLNMPFMNGFEFLSNFKTFPDSLKERFDIQVLTSSYNPDDREKVMEFREVRRYLHKPLPLEFLRGICKGA